MTKVHSWGRLSKEEHSIIKLNDLTQFEASLQISAAPGLAHGMGRSYGDVCLNTNGTLWHTTGLDHFIAFDECSGRLSCEAGVLLGEIQRLAIPRGWILPVTPGTKFVTVGGAIANDVHGKNHHARGSFGDHVRRLTLIRTDGEVINCGPDERSDWFFATVGGMGLTGLVARAEIQLMRVCGPWLATETQPYSCLDEFFRLADSSEAGWEYTVAWIDCITNSDGRGLFTRANSSRVNDYEEPQKRPLKMHISPPVSLVHGVSMRAFNMAYFHSKRRIPTQGIAHYERFFYPLDNILDWNRMYGPKGFFQYQSVVPREVGQDALKAMLKEIVKSGEGSFLAVLKTFGGRESGGMLSFPRMGVTLALDFPNRGERTHKLFERLDSIVLEAKGRLYMAKDARMSREMFEVSYPRMSEFMRYRDQNISSNLSRRLMGS